MEGNGRFQVLFSPERKTLGKKAGFYCFCCCNPTNSHRIMDHFMNEKKR